MPASSATTAAAAAATGAVAAAPDVRPVRSRADLSAFLGFPYRLHRDEPLWVPPLRSEQRRLLDRRRHPFFDFGTVRLFLARRDGRVVGRVAAVDNPAAQPPDGPRRGFFGMFECVNSPEAARALFAAAGEWLTERGLGTVLGPVNFSTNYECGLLIEGFDERPAVQMPYNPPYYPELLAGCGFVPASDLLAWEMPTTAHDSPACARLSRLVARRRDIRIRPVDLRDFAGEAALIRDLYNRAWQDNWGFTPMSDREFDHLARQLRPLLHPELCLIAEVDGEPAGFGLALPDVAPALAAAGGRLHTWGMPLGLFRLLRARRRLDRVRLLALGVLAEHRLSGVDLGLFTELSRAARRLGYQHAEISWTLAGNGGANRLLRFWGARTTKRYRLYERPL